jgi:hypothetical protein
MSISQNFPEEGPTLNLNFAGSRTLDPRITFTRTSSATFMGRDGLVKIAPANSARFDHRYNSTTGEVESLGLLVEEARSNLLTYSEDFSIDKNNASGTILEPNIELSPSGNLTADKFSVGTSNFPQSTQTVTTTVSSTYTLSYFVKNAGLNFIQIRLRNAESLTSFFRAIFNLTTGQITSTGQFGNGSFIGATSTNVGNGWWKCSITGIADTSGSLITSLVILTLDENATVATPDNSNSTDGIYIWGAQLEAGAFPTSYIPTTTSTVTRTADNVSMVGENFSSWYNQSEGTISTQFLIKDKYPANGIVYLNINQNVNDSLRLFYNDGISAYSVSNRVSGVQNAILNLGGFSSNQKEKISFSYKLNDFSSSRNGLSPITASSGTLSSNNRLDIGVIQGGNHLNGHIAQLTYYPNRLSNSQLITLTK